MKGSKIVSIVLGSLLLTVLGVSLFFYIYKPQVFESDNEIEVLVVIDFGALTSVDDYIEEYVIVTEGQSAYYAFSLVAELTVSYHPLMDGVFVEGVNGFMQSGDNYWFFYYYNADKDLWDRASKGVSHYFLYEGDRIKLAYENS